MQIGQDSSINIPHNIGLSIVNGKRHFSSFMEFYVMQLKNQGVKY